MNKTRISKKFLHDLIDGIKTRGRNRKTRDFLEKWNPTLRQGKLYHQNKLIVPYEDVPKVLKLEAETNGMPLSRDGAYHYLLKKYIGFKRKHIMEWLKSVEQLQMIHKKPYINTRANKVDREGTKNWFMAKDGRLNLGVDLFQMPKPQWSSYGYFFVAVLQRSGFTWIYPMKNKKAITALAKLKLVFKDCKSRFGQHPSGVTSDDGNEFKGKFDEYLKNKGIKRRILSDRGQMCWWVEKKNSTFARIFATMKNIYGFERALKLTRLKVNNIRSRITRKAPVDWKPEDFLKHTPRYNRKVKHIPTKRKQPKYVEGQKVRHLMRHAMGKVAFYKSYEGLRSDKHQMWSKTIYKIMDVKRLGHYLHYRVNGAWRRANELQLIERPVVRLVGHIRKPAAPKKKPAKKMKRGFPPKMKRGFPPKKAAAPSAAPAPRRSTRIRKAPKRYGFS